MPDTKLNPMPLTIEESRRALEAQLSQEQCELLRKIRALRTAIGPVTKDAGTMLRELDETGMTNAA